MNKQYIITTRLMMVKGAKAIGLLCMGYICILLSFSSCKKVLNVPNQGALEQNTVWSDPASINLLVNNIYTLGEPDDFTVGFAGSNVDGYRYTGGVISDEGRPSTTFIGRTNGINNGVAFLVTGCPFQTWPYDIIRQCNDFLQKINTLYVLSPSAAPDLVRSRNAMMGQVLFFRAYTYWTMVRIYGGVPIVDKVLSPGDSALYAPRNTQEECFQFMKKDLENAADLLPATWSGNDAHRINKGAAWALLGRILLYRASPMYNTGGTQSYWKDAADASKKVLDSSSYSLYGQFGRWFFDKSNPESIWQIDYEYPQRQHGWDAAQMPNVPWAIGDAVATCPTQELVDAFPMINGKAISDPASGYNPNDPYSNRDPRMRATVITNGDVFGANAQINGGAPVRIWSYIGGNDSYSEGSDYNTSTGYYMRKMMDTTLLTAVPRLYSFANGSSSNWVEIRLAEVMLNYAEAQNELGNSGPAYTYIGMLRQRAGIPPGTDGNYGLTPGMSTAQVRSVIQNERFIELAYENKRYWDLKRWRLAASVLSRPTHVMKITKLTPDPVPPSTNAADYQFDPTAVNANDRAFPPVFLEKYYFLPLMQNQLQLNPKLTQNQLWQ